MLADRDAELTEEKYTTWDDTLEYIAHVSSL